VRSFKYNGILEGFYHSNSYTRYGNEL